MSSVYPFLPHPKWLPIRLHGILQLVEKIEKAVPLLNFSVEVILLGIINIYWIKAEQMYV